MVWTNEEGLFDCRVMNMTRILRGFRNIHGYTQGQLAVLVGVSRGTVTKWENGYHKPSNLARRRLELLFESYTNDK